MKDFYGPWRCLILLCLALGLTLGQVLNVQRCTDPQCQGKVRKHVTFKHTENHLTFSFTLPGVVSEGRTVLKYHANSNSMLSFGMNQPVRIFSKGEGVQEEIWGVEVRGNGIDFCDLSSYLYFPAF